MEVPVAFGAEALDDLGVPSGKVGLVDAVLDG